MYKEFLEVCSSYSLLEIKHLYLVEELFGERIVDYNRTYYIHSFPADR